MNKKHLISILMGVGLVFSIAFFVYYFLNKSSSGYTLFAVLLYLLLPAITLLLIKFSNIKTAVLLLIIQNVIEILFIRPFALAIFQILFVIIPLFLFYRYLKDNIMIFNFVNMKTIIIMFAILAFVYFCLSVFSLWQILKTEIIFDALFEVNTFKFTRYLVRFIIYICLTILLINKKSKIQIT